MPRFNGKTMESANLKAFEQFVPTHWPLTAKHRNGQLENRSNMWRRYVRLIRPNVPLCDLASLNWVSHRVPSSPAGACRSKTLETGVDTHTKPKSALTKRGREEKKETEERKGKEGVPSYDTSVQGHAKRRREGFPAMTKASRDTQKKKEEGERKKKKKEREKEREREGKEKRKKRRKQVFPATRKRPGTHQGEGYT